MNPLKTYVTVIVRITPDGNKCPQEIIWKDGRRFEVTRIFNVRQAAAMKVGGTGVRYEIEVNRHRTFIWDEDGRWFVEEMQHA